jgi:hypothetical protein
MGRNNADFSGGIFGGLPDFPSIRPKIQGPDELAKATPSAEDQEKHGVEAYTVRVKPGEDKKDVGKKIAGAVQSGLPKPSKVEFNKE